MEHSVFEEHEIHLRIQLVVAVKRLDQDLREVGKVCDRRVLRLADALREVTVEEWFLEEYSLVLVLK